MQRRFAVIMGLFLLSAMATQASIVNQKEIPDWGYVEINFGVVTGEFFDSFEAPYDFFYCQRTDRTSAVRVKSESYAFGGNLISCWGYLVTNEAGEREIEVIDGFIIDIGYPLPRPLGMNQRAMKTGLIPKGLLSRICGKVTLAKTDDYPRIPYYMVDDGSGLSDIQGRRGVKVRDAYREPVEGEWLNISGILSYEKDESEQIIPIFYRAHPDFEYQEGRGLNRYTIGGWIVCDVEAAGKTARIATDNGIAACQIDENGIGQFQITLPKGNYALSAELAGYATYTIFVPVFQDMPETLWLFLSPCAKIIDMTPSDVRIAPGEAKRIKARYRDAEGRAMPRQTISWETDFGNIIDADLVTDDNGVAYATLAGLPDRKVATVWARTNETTAGAWVETATEGVPWIRIASPLYHEEVTGIADLEFVCEDTNANGAVNIGKYQLFADGQFLSACRPKSYDPESGEVIIGGFDTMKLANGNHSIWIKVWDRLDGEMVSNVVPIVVNNPVSIQVDQENLHYDESPTGFTFTGELNQGSSWSIEILGIADEPENEPVIWSAAGSGQQAANSGPGQIIATWDGKVDGQYKTGVYEAKFKVDGAAVGGGTFMAVSQGSAEMFEAAIIDGDSKWMRQSTKRTLNRIAEACNHKNVPVTIELNPYWYSEDVGTPHRKLGMNFWLGVTQRYHYFYLNCHGESDKSDDGKYRTSLFFADGVAVQGDDRWLNDPIMEGITEAFSDIYIPRYKFRISEIDACYSAGNSKQIDTSFAKSLGCVIDEFGTTYIGWIGQFKPLGWSVTFSSTPNGEGVVRGIWYYLGDSVHTYSLYEAIERLDQSSDPRFKGYMRQRLYLYTWYTAQLIWLGWS